MNKNIRESLTVFEVKVRNTKVILELDPGESSHTIHELSSATHSLKTLGADFLTRIRYDKYPSGLLTGLTISSAAKVLAMPHDGKLQHRVFYQMATKALVEDWYDAHAEAEEHRLDDARLEFEVTKRVISDCIISLGVKEANVIDIGGGPGRYAISLAQQGHHVTLNDLSAKSLAIAEANARTADVSLEAVIHANALDITRHAASSSFDVVLCLGPLYHLTVREERACVVTNALAMAKPGAYVILAYVTVFGHLRDMARRDSSRLVNEWGFYEKYLRTGVYDRRPDNESFHVYPRDVEGELASVKSEAAVVKIVSCEGFLGFETGRALAKVKDEDMERWVDVVMQSADQPHTFNSAEHLLVVLKKF